MRLIDADAFKAKLAEEEITFPMLDFAPTMDAVPLIRCKDCKHHEDADPGMVYCPNIVGGWVEEEGYCYLAERKEE